MTTHHRSHPVSGETLHSAVTLLALCRTPHEPEARAALRALVAAVAPACASVDQCASALGIGRSTLTRHIARWRQEGSPVEVGWARHPGAPTAAEEAVLVTVRAAAALALPEPLRARLDASA